ncbi:MAG TPA: PIN domain-containing protein [Gaiellaceae bacterium]
MILIDTSALFACLDRADAEHGRAVATFDELSEADDLVTHTYVVVETASLVQRRLGSGSTRALFDDLLPAVQTLGVDDAVHHAAVAALIASGSRSVSLVDWTSFEVMRRLGIEEAFAFDEDFARQGFAVRP